jgi:tripartite-type tricarboxylate transporter receptor subunit TctC
LSVPANNARELIALARSRAGQLNMASGGAGSGQHIAGELFNLMAHTRMTHVPYKGTAPAINDIMAVMPMSVFSIRRSVPQVKAGRLKRSASRASSANEPLPSVPPINDRVCPAIFP